MSSSQNIKEAIGLIEQRSNRLIRVGLVLLAVAGGAMLLSLTQKLSVVVPPLSFSRLSIPQSVNTRANALRHIDDPIMAMGGPDSAEGKKILSQIKATKAELLSIEVQELSMQIWAKYPPPYNADTRAAMQADSMYFALRKKMDELLSMPDFPTLAISPDKQLAMELTVYADVRSQDAKDEFQTALGINNAAASLSKISSLIAAAITGISLLFGGLGFWLKRRVKVLRDMITTDVARDALTIFKPAALASTWDANTQIKQTRDYAQVPNDANING